MIHRRIADWLETHWVSPAYSGWLMAGLALFFFGAATNTMAGWLYAISGVMTALLVLGALLPGRSLRTLAVTRRPIAPVSVGDGVRVEVAIANLSREPKTLLQVTDHLPLGLGQPPQTPVELIPADGVYQWTYSLVAQRRGIYRWQRLDLRTAAPLGLFWCRRQCPLPATAVVYPTVLPLSRCPLIDEMGRDLSRAAPSDYRAQTATEGVTRTLRPYRWGDPTRLIHWRTSARYSELRVRELETYTGGQELVICLDSGTFWEAENFEQAVSAAASLYFYALRRERQVSLWTAATGRVRGDRTVLEVLASTQAAEAEGTEHPPDLPLLWLTQHTTRLPSLPDGSRWLLWTTETAAASAPAVSESCLGLVMQPQEELQLQLQQGGQSSP